MMKFNLVLFSLALLLPCLSMAQEVKPDSLYHHDAGEKIYLKTEVDKIAEFPGGEQMLFKWLVNNVLYPQQAKEDGRQGKVYGTFVVEKDGSITDSKIIKGVCESLDMEYLRVVKNFPKWVPAVKDGMPVRMQIIYPLKFTLN